jgi:hypothetical protein
MNASINYKQSVKIVITIKARHSRHIQWLDANSQHPLRRRVIRLLFGIASASEELPKTLFIDGLSMHYRDPTSLGSFADVYRAQCDEQTVALKRLRINEHGRDRSQLHRASSATVSS